MDALRLILLVVGIVVVAAIYVIGRRGRDSGPRFAYIRDLLSARAKRGDDIPELDISSAVRPGEDDGPEADDAAVSASPDAWRDAPSQPSLPGDGSVADPVSEPVVSAHAEPALGELDGLNRLVAERGPAIPDEAALGTVEPADDALDEFPGPAPDPDEQLILVFYVLAPQGHAFAGTALRAALEETGFHYGQMQIFHYYGEPGDATSTAGRAPGTKSRRPVLSLANALEPGTFDPETMEDFTTPGVSLFLQLPGPLEGREAFDRLLGIGRALAEGLGGELCDDSRSVLTPQTISHLREQVEAFRFKLQMGQVGKQRK